jgi:uncharacterized protein YndB with AHSA1/START domain
MTTDTPSVPRKKRHILRKLFFTLIGVIAVLAIVVALQPADYRVERSATINAPPPVVFAQVNDFHNWEAWSPWAKLDPTARNSFEGPPAGAGAIFRWSGNDKVGQGLMTILDSRASDQIKIKLDFIRPFTDTATTDFTFKPQGDQTTVTWSMSGHRNFMAKAICLFMNMDRSVGGDFEKGLAQIKATAEAAARK